MDAPVTTVHDANPDPGKIKTITIEVTAEEIDALEDLFFTKLDEEARDRLDEAKHSLWTKISTAFDFDEEEAEG